MGPLTLVWAKVTVERAINAEIVEKSLTFILPPVMMMLGLGNSLFY